MKRNTQDGFTIIEVLIAMTVFAVGILAVISMQTTAVGGNAKAVAISKAAQLASEQMEELMGLSYDNITTDSKTLPGHSVSWTVTAGDPISNVKEINLTVTSTAGPATTTELVFYKMKKQ